MRISAGILVCAVMLMSLAGVCGVSIPIALAATAGNDTATTNEDTAVTISVLGNDTGVGLKLASAGVAAHGTAVVLDPVAGTVRYTPVANWNGTDSFTYTITEGSTLYSSATGHYYEFVSAPGGTWIQARDGAAGRTLYGLHGYLVTITSAEEQTFVQTKLLGKGWMGAGDAVVEGQWRWMTGPEAGTALGYAHWAAGEPNDSGGNEDYAHFYADGLWNDFNENNSSTDGYVVEYGGMAGDTPIPPPTATVTVIVAPVNDSPVALPDTFTTAEDTALVVAAPGLLVNDTDIDGPSLQAIFGSGPSHGSVSLSSDGSFRYTPTHNYSGSDSFRYSVWDGARQSPTVAVSLTITPVNDPPAGITMYGGSVSENAPPGTQAGWFTTQDPETTTGFTYTLSGEGADVLELFNVNYVRTKIGLDFETTSSYMLHVRTADSGGLSYEQDFVVTVTNVNEAPAAANDSYASAEDVLMAVPVPGLLANDIDVDGDTLTARLLTGPDHGAVVLQADGSFTYLPAADYCGLDTFTYEAWDGSLDSPATTVTLAVTSVNDAPSFTKGADQTVLEDCGTQMVSGWAAAISAGPANEMSQAVDFAVTNDNSGLFSSQPTISSSGALSYTPAADMNGTASVTVCIHDDGGTVDGGVNTSASQTFLLTVHEINDAPTAVTDTCAMLEDSTLTLTTSQLLSNDLRGPANESGQDLMFLGAGMTPVNCTVTMNAEAITIHLSPDVNGSSSFGYIMQDMGTTAGIPDPRIVSGIVSITVTPVNDAPSFTKGADQTVLEDCGTQMVSGWATAISTGPADETGQALDFIVTNDNNILFSSQPAIDPSGALTWTPAADMNGTATVTVRIHDSGGTTNGGVNTSIVQTFTIIVTVVNDAPSFAKGADQTVLEDCGPQTVASWATAIDAGPSDESIQTLHFTVANDNTALFSVQPAIDPSGALSYTPAADMNGTASVTVCIHDDGGMVDDGVNMSVSRTFIITVGTVNDAPHFTLGVDQVVLEDCGLQTIPGWAVSMSTGPANEAGQILDFIVTNDRNALFAAQPAITADGVLTYVPAANMNGTTVVTVRLRDNGGIADGGVDISAPETFTITVMAANDAPVHTALPTISGISHAGQQLMTTTGVWNDSTDLVPGSLDYAFQWQRSTDGGATFVDIPGATAPEYRVVPADNLMLIRSRVTCTDDSEGLPLYQSVSVVSAPVGVVNTAPAITEGVGVLVTCDEDESPTVFGLTLHATDADDIDTLMWHIVVPPVYGTLTLPVDRSGPAIAPAYHPAPDWNGTDSFVLRVEDGLAGFGEIVVRVIVNPRNDAPVNTVLPGIDGGVFVNHEIHAVVGSWNDVVDYVRGNLAYTYQWLRASDATGTGLTLVPGAIAPSYIVSPLDEGMYLAVRITCMDKGEGLPGSMATSVNSGLRLARYLDIAPPTIELPDFSAWPGVAGWSGAVMQTFTVSSSPFPLQFTLDDNSGPVKWAIRVNGVIVIDPVERGVITCPVPLSEGRNNIEISASDASDNTTSVKLVIYLDTMGPVLTVEPVVPTSVTASRLTIAGSVVDVTSGLKRVTINGTTVTPYLDGSFRETLTLTRGINTIVIEAEDKAGHTASATRTVTYATTIQPLPAATVITLTIGETTMSINGMAVALDTAPVIRESRTMLPIRAIAEAIDASVAWDPVTRKVTITRGATRLELWIGRSVAKLNGTSVSIDPANSNVVPCITSGRTMLPVRFIAEALGLDVGWYPPARTVTITWEP